MIRKFFLKRFLLFFIVMMIPSILLGSVYCVYVNRSIRTKIEGNTEKSLTSVCDSVELILGSASYQQQLLTNSPRLTLSLTKMLNQDYISYEDSVILSCVNSILTSAVNNNLYIKNIYFYIVGCRKFLSTSDGISSLDGYYDSQWMQSYLRSNKNVDMWVEKRNVKENSYRPETEVVSIYQRIKNAVGIIVINIFPDRFQTILNRIQTESGQSLFILDSNNNILFSNEAGSVLKQSNEQLFQDITDVNDAQNLKMLPVKIANKSYVMSRLDSDKYGVRLVSLIPEEDLYRQPNEFIMLFLMITFATAIVVLLLSYYITNKNFKQINHLLAVFEHAEKGGYTFDSPQLFRDEYDVILNNIVKLFIGTSQLKLQLAEKQYKQKAAEFSALQMQINPHFLFNTLQTLNMESIRLLNGTSEINQIIQDLSDILKYSLQDSSKPVTLRDEIKYLHIYTDIQQYRYENKFILYYEYDEEVLNVPVFRLLLQPLIENSLYHGIKPMDGKGYIKLKIRRKGESLLFRVIDNGVGMTEEELCGLRNKIKDESNINIGLTNVNHRLILHFGEKSSLKIRSKQNCGTVISFCIPAQPKEQ